MFYTHIGGSEKPFLRMNFRLAPFSISPCKSVWKKAKQNVECVRTTGSENGNKCTTTNSTDTDAYTMYRTMCAKYLCALSAVLAMSQCGQSEMARFWLVGLTCKCMGEHFFILLLLLFVNLSSSFFSSMDEEKFTVSLTDLVLVFSSF